MPERTLQGAWDVAWSGAGIDRRRMGSDPDLRERPMRHVEFLGIPASGKTTLAEHLLDRRVAADRVIVAPSTRAPTTPRARLSKRWRDLVSVSLQVLGSPARSYRIWHACRAFRQPSVVRWFRLYLNCLRVDQLARSAKTRARQNEILVLDQGVYQAVWSLALRAQFRSDEQFVEGCRRLLACLAAPGLVVMVDTPVDVARQRLAQEPDEHGRLPALLASEPGWMHRAQEILDSLWALADTEPQTDTLRYRSGKDSLEDIGSALRAFARSDQPSAS